MTTPSDRLRALHRHCSCWGESCKKQGLDLNSHCYKCLVNWPCDTIKALDAADALADAVEKHASFIPSGSIVMAALRAYRGTQ